MENERRKVHEELEVVQTGFANGVAEGFPLKQSEKNKMIDEAEEAYGKFLDAQNVTGGMILTQWKPLDV